MGNWKEDVISCDVDKYPYYTMLDGTEDDLSDKICCYSVRIGKKIIKKVNWVIVYGDFVLHLSNGVISSQGIGLPIPSIIRSIWQI